MGNANSGNVRERHKSGDSLPPSSPCGVGVIKDGQAFTFDKRSSVGSSSQSQAHPQQAIQQGSNPPSPAVPATHLHASSTTSTSSGGITPPPPPTLLLGGGCPADSSSANHHHKIIQLQHSQSNDDDEPYFTRHPMSKSLSKDVSVISIRISLLLFARLLLPAFEMILYFLFFWNVCLNCGLVALFACSLLSLLVLVCLQSTYNLFVLL